MPSVVPTEPTPTGSVPTVTGSVPTVTAGLPTFTGSLPTVTAGVPTVTGGIPVLEDAADAEVRTADAARTRGAVTALVITVLTTISAIGPLATDMYVPAFPQVTDALGTTAARMQLTLTAFFLGSAAGQVIAGPLSDRVGRRGPMMFGLALCLLASIGCAMTQSVELLLVLRILQGFGGGFGMVLGRAVVIDLSEGPELFRVMNIMQGVGGIAPIVAPLLGGAIMMFGQWREVFVVIAVMSGLSLLGTILLVPESLDRSRRHSGGLRTFARNVGTLLRRRTFMSYLFVNAFSAFALMAYVSASSFILQSMLGFDATTYSVLFAVNSLGMMGCSLLSARLSRRFHPRQVARVGLSLVAVGSVVLFIGAVFLGTPVWIVLPGFFLVVAPQGLIFGNTGAMASDEAREFAGTGSAMLGLGFSFAASASAPIVGIAGTHSAVPMAVVMVIGCALSAVCFRFAGLPGRSDREAQVIA